MNSTDGFFAALLAVLLLVIAGFVGASVARGVIKSECDRFGQTYVSGTQYACTALGKEASRGGQARCE